MRVIIQRVKKVSLSANGKPFSQIDKGLLVYLGIAEGDNKQMADYLVKKINNLRIFEDENGKMNLNIHSIGGSVMLVSNFTLYANTQGTNRPDFIKAAKPEISKPLYDYFIEELKKLVPTTSGVFGADMQINAEIDGPINIIIEK